MNAFRPFTPSPAYRLFLTRLIETRENRGFSQERLGEYLGLTQDQIQAFESGDHPLGFIDVRNWLLALDMPFVEFTTQMEEVLDSTLTHDETIAPPTNVTASSQPESP
jgi:transcriptional regulator with XRE-family HTH domain